MAHKKVLWEVHFNGNLTKLIKNKIREKAERKYQSVAALFEWYL